jgi:hypothetical protein
MFKPRLIAEPNVDVINSIQAIDTMVFPHDHDEVKQEIVSILRFPRSICFTMLFEQDVVGYVATTPTSNLPHRFYEADPSLRKADEYLYLHTLAIVPRHQGGKINVHQACMQTVVNQARIRGIKQLCMHIPLLQKNVWLTQYPQLEASGSSIDWNGNGVLYEYLELKLHGNGGGNAGVPVRPKSPRDSLGANTSTPT